MNWNWSIIYIIQKQFLKLIWKNIKTIYDSSTFEKDDKKIIFLVDLNKSKKTSLKN